MSGWVVLMNTGLSYYATDESWDIVAQLGERPTGSGGWRLQYRRALLLRSSPARAASPKNLVLKTQLPHLGPAERNRLKKLEFNTTAGPPGGRTRPGLVSFGATGPMKKTAGG